MSQSTKHVVYADYSLIGLGGHNATLSDTLLKANPEMEVWAHRGCRIDHPRIKKVFKHSGHSPKYKLPPNDGLWLWFAIRVVFQTIRSNIMVAEELFRAKEKTPDVLIIGEASSKNFYGAAFYYLLKRKELNMVLYFYMPLNRFLLGLGSLFMRHTGLKVAAENQHLCDQYSSYLKVPCSLLYYPVLENCSDNVIRENHLVFLFIGSARIEKGYDVLVEAIRMIADSGEEPPFKILMTETSNFDGSLDDKLSAERLIGSLGWVETFGDRLEVEEYAEKFDRANVVLLPYKEYAYGKRGSGIVCEAIANRKPIITTDGTIVSDVVKENGAGIFITDESPRELRDAMYQAVGSFDELKSQAEVKGRSWNEHHSAKAFIRKSTELFS